MTAPGWVTRFAPSPTGDLHLGHVLHCHWLWTTARDRGARVVIRMEDHDRTRCTPAFEASILEDLEWLGFQPDAVALGSLTSHPSPYRQSDHPQRYQHAFEQLSAVAEVYACTCTRAMLPMNEGGERRYPGTCRGRGRECTGNHVLRAVIPDGEAVVDDLRLGRVVQHPQRDHGDVVIRDARGQWTYQFCVAVDDLDDGVNLIVRGEDLLPSTGTQLLLGQLLGRTDPFVTLHHPLLCAPDRRKLSKRDRSETVRAMRERGMNREEVVARALSGQLMAG